MPPSCPADAAAARVAAARLGAAQLRRFEPRLNGCRVTGAAPAGDFSRPVDVAAVDAERRELVGRIDDRVAGVAHGLDEIDAVTEGLGRGDLTRGLSGRCRETFARRLHDVDRMLDALGGLIGERDRPAASRSSGRGRSSRRC
jgi:hypothetical protein